MLRTLFLALLLSCNITDTFSQQVTISNNLLYDAWLTPNLRVGFRMAPHWSIGLTGGYRPWPVSDEATRKYRHLLISPSVRYWKDSVNVHHFWGANLIYSHYNVGGITAVNETETDNETEKKGVLDNNYYNNTLLTNCVAFDVVIGKSTADMNKLAFVYGPNGTETAPTAGGLNYGINQWHTNHPDNSYDTDYPHHYVYQPANYPKLN